MPYIFPTIWTRYQDPPERAWLAFFAFSGRSYIFAERAPCGAVLPLPTEPPFPSAGFWRTGERCPV